MIDSFYRKPPTNERMHLQKASGKSEQMSKFKSYKVKEKQTNPITTLVLAP